MLYLDCTDIRGTNAGRIRKPASPTLFYSRTSMLIRGRDRRSSSSINYKANIDRQRAKRWVEASVSYDGDDWGGSDYVEW